MGLVVLYATAIMIPPLALWICRKWWQGVLAALAIVLLVQKFPGAWGVLVVGVPLMVYALFAVDRMMGAGQAVRRIKERWGPEPAGQLL
jgi:hypothetical protein